MNMKKMNMGLIKKLFCFLHIKSKNLMYENYICINE